MADHTETIETSQHTGAEEHKAKSFTDPDVSMLILTWVTFVCLLAILHKFAWKPILASLDEREKSIRRAVEDAERTRQELEKIDQTRLAIISEAELRAKQTIDEARKGAVEAAHAIQQKAKQESQILIENAEREITAAKNKAKAELKEESAQIAFQLASKLLEENLDSEKNRKLVSNLLREI